MLCYGLVGKQILDGGFCFRRFSHVLQVPVALHRGGHSFGLSEPAISKGLLDGRPVAVLSNKFRIVPLHDFQKLLRVILLQGTEFVGQFK
jgi:hypothetical protein